MNPYYEHGGITIYHGDCRELSRFLQADAVVTDPPYGMGWDVDSTRFSGGSLASRLRRGTGNGTSSAVIGDDEPFDPSPWLDFDSVVLWGSNHYAARLPTGTTVVWVKRNDDAFGTFLSDGEVGWVKGGHGVYCFRDLSMCGEAKVRAHPTQKPVPLFRWCIERYAKLGTILDPFMGSGTTLRAAKDLGRKAIGIEIEERYCEIAARRLGQEVFAFD